MTAVLPSLTDPATIADPFTAYDLIRENRPVYRNTELGIVLVTRYQDAMRVLTDPDAFSSRWVRRAREHFTPQDSVRKILDQGFEEAEVLTWADGKNHSYHASVLKPFLTPSAVRAMAPALQQIASGLVGKLVESWKENPNKAIDIVQVFAIPMAIEAMCSFVGVPPDRIQLFSKAGDAEVALQGSKLSEEDAIKAAKVFVELQLYIADEIKRRIEKPTDDLISAVANAQPPEGAEPLSLADQVSLVKLAVVAGNETTRGLISSCFKRFAEHPALMQRARDEGEFLEKFIAETLRTEPPVLLLFRIATEDVTVGDFLIEEGEMVAVCYGAANYDPAAFACPHEFNPERTGDQRHLAFGFGIHYCLGATLARLETEIALSAFLHSFESMRLAEDALVYNPFFMSRTLANLPIYLEA